MAGSYTAQDISMTNTGGFVVAPNGDLQLAPLGQTMYQDAILRIYTNYNDFQAIPAIGSMITTWMGQANNSTNAQSLQAEVLRALTADGQFAASDISARIVPVAIDTVYVYVTIQNTALTYPINFSFNFNYIQGLQINNLSGPVTE